MISDHADQRQKRILPALVLAGALAAASLVGCSNVINQGGDTTCKDFLSQDDNRQKEEISKMLKDEHKNDPSNLEITAASTAALGYCKTLGNENSKISEAPHL